MKLNVVVAEAALELIPRELWRDPSVVSDSARRAVQPSRILLDRSFHHRAMLRLRDGEKRGRPDLVHATLLSISGAPLYTEGMVKVYVHAFGDVVIEVREKTRIPKSYFRFRGLMEQALAERPKTGLLKVWTTDFRELIRQIGSDSVIGLSTRGRSVSMEELAAMVSAAKNPTVVIGGFAHGHFSTKATEAMDELVRIHERQLDAHVVASRVLYEVEKRTARTND
ncbi:MAG: ribosome biogenesis protein [Nitrososphaerota archaeon]|nr:ribosome biogenesis protein [Nitrososphaerota archaeon]